MARDPLSQLRSRVRVAGGLPVFSESLQQVLELIHAPDTTMPTLARAIERDPALSARVLKLANSAYYGLSATVASLNLALVLLGLRNVRTLAQSIGFLDILKEVDSAPSYPGRNFREHCVLTGRIASALARMHNKGEGGEEFVAGLIHDIGKLVLFRAYEDRLDDAARLVSANSAARSDSEAEQHATGARLNLEQELQVFGLHHAQVGAWAAREWKLPTTLVEAIEQHDPNSRDFTEVSERGQELALLIESANRAAHWIQGNCLATPEALPEEWQSDPWLMHPKLTTEVLLAEVTADQV